MAFRLRKPPKLLPKTTAFPYQLEAVRTVRNLPFAAIFHEQGLGKTKMAIDIALYWLAQDTVDTVFIVTKKSLVKNWTDEIGIHSDLVPRTLSEDRKANSFALNAPVLMYVLNYEVCRSSFDLIELYQQTCRIGAILDESQKIKNPDARLTQCFLALAPGFVRRIIMTGTPVANRPYDIWAQVKFLDGGSALGDDFHSFKSVMDIPKRQADIEYGQELGTIHEKIKGFTVRETKKSSGLELPRKIISTVAVELAPRQRAMYEQYKRELSLEIKPQDVEVIDDAENILKRLLRLVQCAANPGIIDKSYLEEPAKFARLRELLVNQVKGGKAIVWTSFIDNAAWLAKKLADLNPQVIHGKRDIATRNRAIEAFKVNETCKLLIATPGAAKEGLTLTVANHAIFYDRSFSLDDYLQAQDRIHRISQQDECHVYNLVATNTIDEWVDQLLYGKYMAAQLAQGDISEADGQDLYQMDLSEMLREVLAPDSTTTRGTQ